MSENLEDIKRSRNYQRDRVKQVKIARNRNADGLAYWRERAMGFEWRPIETAPKDGNPVLLLSKEHTDPADINGGPYHHPAKCAIGRWHADGTSWCDEHGRFPDDPEVDDDSINLHVTGVWFSGGGWFQPNEVTHWMPLPLPPSDSKSVMPEGARDP